MIGLGSSGVHSNGFSLIRQLFDIEDESFRESRKELEGKSLAEVLLEPTRIYVSAIKRLLENEVVPHGISHITGGGFYENIPRILKDNQKALIHTDRFSIPPIFSLIQDIGHISDEEMYSTFNMGIGMVLAVNPEDVDSVLAIVKDLDYEAYLLGEIVPGQNEVELV